MFYRLSHGCQLLLKNFVTIIAPIREAAIASKQYFNSNDFIMSKFFNVD